MKSSGSFLRNVLIAALLSLSAWRANAAYDAFLNIAGISGESTANGHTNEITVLNFSLGVTNTGTTTVFSGLRITKVLDKASPFLVLDCGQKTEISKIILTLRDQSGPQVEFYKITLHNATVTSVTASGNNSDARPTEIITLSFEKIDWDYQPVDTSGNPVGPRIQTSFSLTGQSA